MAPSMTWYTPVAFPPPAVVPCSSETKSDLHEWWEIRLWADTAAA